MTKQSFTQGPGVRFPPPVLFVGALVAAWLVARLVRPMPLAADGRPLATAGTVLIVLGVALAAWGMITFRRARTAIVPMHPASRIVTNGPYRFTRNPMYTGLTLVYLGVSLYMNSVWPLLALPIVLALLIRLVVRREEAYLRSAFGEEYLAYQSRVRRWL
ncbi:MAG TPA: isoprenylcysteine carboxylmethyltransferase family protein [Gemmatimonadaceae bacterium]|nr:isoprenylcysteine carboxylmethyltransferase family protein [Gemmatimonadaceae bacterium]